jgi:trimeric autotransporter adhesin
LGVFLSSKSINHLKPKKMKKLLLFALVLFSFRASAQWMQTLAVGRSLPTVATIGVGFFPASGPFSPAARLHVNEFYMAAALQPPLAANMFRTDGFSKFDNKWQLFTGSAANSLTEKFLLMVPNSTDHVLLQASRPNANISFNTGGANFRMVILGSNGFVGIGTPTPNNLLDVDGGDIDVNTNTKSYMIGDRQVLWHKGNTTNLFVGVGAGIGLTSGNSNTFMGNNAGGSIATANQNTMVGCEAGPNAGGTKNTFMGYRAGYNWGPNQVVSTLIGAEAGFSETMGDEHVMVGWRAGYNTNGAVHNTFVGNIAGFANTTGGSNTFIGIGSGGANSTGFDNVALGAGSGMATANLVNSTAIGAGSIVTGNDNMILGTVPVNVGIGLSGATPGPANKLEIDAGLNGTSPVAAGNVGASGLRFRDLHAQTLTVANPGKGVLAVDVNGDVIYVPAPVASGGPAFGNLCGGTSAPMSGTWEIPTAGFNYMFNDIFQGGTSEVGIGHLNGTCGNLLNSKFEVFSDRHQFSGFFDNSAALASQITYGVFGHAASTTDGSVGVKGYAQAAAANGTSIGIGVEGESAVASGSAFNYGVNGIAANGGSESRAGNFVVDNSPSLINYGVKSVITNPMAPTLENYAGYFETTNIAPPLTNKSFGVVGSIDSPVPYIAAMPTGTSIGVYGYNPRNTAGLSSPNIWAAYFDGDMNTNGSAWWWGTNWQYSDRRLKKDITPLGDVTERLSHLNSYTYTMRQDEFSGKNFDNRTHIGFIAQEVKEVFPELVNEDAKGYIAVNYEGMIPVLLQAVKEQQTTIENQQKQIDELRALVQEQIQASKSSNSSSQTVNLSDKTEVILDQNVPNPFSESTRISYSVPDEARDARIEFYNNLGQRINTVVLNPGGNGSITVYAAGLSNGIYHYSLLINGQVTDTKKMVKTN